MVTRRPEDRTSKANNRKVVVSCLAALAVMGGITAASPALYRIFCQVTGYGGTTQRAEKVPGRVLERTVTVRFDANVSPHLPWKFEPVQPTMDVKIGESALAFFRATNNSDKPLTGTAGFNIAPDTAGIYFNKIACFCFKEQTLQAGQTVEMPVTFFVDPTIVDDRDTADISVITLSYVFYPVERTAKSPDTAPAGATKSGG